MRVKGEKLGREPSIEQDPNYVLWVIPLVTLNLLVYHSQTLWFLILILSELVEEMFHGAHPHVWIISRVVL